MNNYNFFIIDVRFIDRCKAHDDEKYVFIKRKINIKGANCMVMEKCVFIHSKTIDNSVNFKGNYGDLLLVGFGLL